MESTNQGILGGTQKLYLNRIWNFSNWLVGKEFEITRMQQIELDMFKKSKEIVTIQHVEHLLKLFQESEASESEVIKIIKQFLMDDIIHKGKRASTITIFCSTIKSYFKKNDCPIDFDFSPKSKYKVTTEEELDQFSLTLDDLFKLLTVGRPSIMEKAIVLCKFHRGLDNSTLADRFNFQAWSQLVDYFVDLYFLKYFDPDFHFCILHVYIHAVFNLRVLFWSKASFPNLANVCYILAFL